jgi:hypothetical protein
MAQMPAGMPADMSASADDDTDASSAPGADQAMDDSSQDENQSQVLLTVLANPGGGYTLVQGDESEASEPAEGDDQDAAGADDQADASQKGQTYDSKGALLKGVLEMLNEHEAGPGGTEQANFDQGFGASPSAKTPQKY